VRSAAAVALLLVLTLAGCESNQERSADLSKLARHRPPAQRGLAIAQASADVRVMSTTLVHGSEGDAAVVTLRNDSGNTLKDIPIAISVKDAHGSALFQNNAPGLEAALTSLASLPAHGETSWIDDQVQISAGTPASVSATVGEAPTASGSAPRIEVRGVRPSEEGGVSASAAGTVRNRSSVTQQSLVVYVLARRAGKIVAAGRAVLPEVGAGASLPFQAFLQGDASGARLEASAPATTFG
jgi:hypothetical protein